MTAPSPAASVAFAIAALVIAVLLGLRSLRLMVLIVLGFYACIHLDELLALADDAGSSLLARLKEILQ